MLDIVSTRGAEYIAPEDVNRALNGIDAICEEWRDALSVHSASLVESYHKGKLCCGALIGDRADPSSNFVANINRDSGCWPIGPMLGGFANENGFSNRRIYRNYGSVFIDAIQVTNIAKNLTLPSRIRLYPFYDARSFWANTLKECVVGSAEFRSFFFNRKIGGAKNALRNWAISFHERYGQSVEGGRQIMDCITDAGADIPWQSFDYAKAVNTCKSIRLILGEDFVGIVPVEPLNDLIQFSEVFVCSADFYSART